MWHGISKAPWSQGFGMNVSVHQFNMRRVVYGLVYGVSLFFAVLSQGSVHADETPEEDPSAPWHISADQIHFDREKDEYLARGNVSIMRKNRTLTADTVRLNQGTKDAVAQGNVRLVSGDNVLSGQRLELNLESETGTLVDGTVFIAPNHLYLSGKRIRKTGIQTFSAEKARITSCDGPDPDWKITGSDLKVTIEGYGFAKHTTLWAGKVPVFYSPYLIFQVKLRRQSGLLMPEIGYSDRKGPNTCNRISGPSTKAATPPFTPTPCPTGGFEPDWSTAISSTRIPRDPSSWKGS